MAFNAILSACLVLLSAVISGSSAGSNVCKANSVGDVYFLIDSSGSINARNFEIVQNFVCNFAAEFTIGANGLQIGFGQFSSNFQHIADLNAYASASGICKAVRAIKRLAQYTYTYAALDSVRNNGYLTDKSRGSRTGVPRFLVILTDGQSQNTAKTLFAAALLRALGIEVMVVAIAGFDLYEVRGIAGKRENVFTVNSFDTIDLIKQRTIQRLCDATIAFNFDCYLPPGGIYTNTPPADPNIKDVAPVPVSPADRDPVDIDYPVTQPPPPPATTTPPPPPPPTTTTTTTTTTPKPTTTTTTTTTPKPTTTTPKPTTTTTTTTTPKPTTTTPKPTTTTTTTTTPKPTTTTTTTTTPEPTTTTPKPTTTTTTTTTPKPTTTTTTTTTPRPTTTTTTTTTPAPTAKPCPSEYELDLVFCVDGSGSIGEANFYKNWDFIRIILKAFHISLNYVRVGIYTFGSSVKEIVVPLSGDNATIFQKIENVYYQHSTTETSKCIRAATALLIPGERTNAKKFLVIVTDGQSTTPGDTHDAAVEAKSKGVTISTVGVTDSVNRTEIRDISSSDSLVFEVEDYDRLPNLAPAFAEATCDANKNS